MHRRRSVALATVALRAGMGGSFVIGAGSPLAGARQEVPVAGPLQFNASGPVRVNFSVTTR